MTNLDTILKTKDTTLQMKIHVVKAMVFPVVMYGCEYWTVKKAEAVLRWQRNRMGDHFLPHKFIKRTFQR